MQQDALVARRETEHLRCLLGIHTKHVPDCDDLALADGQQRDGVIDDTPQLQDTEALLRLLVPRDGRHRPAPVAAEPVGVDRGLTTKAAERSGSGFPDTRAPGLVDEDPADPGLQRRPPLKRRQRLEDRQPRVLNRVLGRLCRARVVARAAQQSTGLSSSTRARKPCSSSLSTGPPVSRPPSSCRQRRWRYTCNAWPFRRHEPGTAQRRGRTEAHHEDHRLRRRLALTVHPGLGVARHPFGCFRAHSPRVQTVRRLIRA